MVTSRAINSGDMAGLQESLSRDPYHHATTAEFFREPGTVCNVYEDEDGPIVFVRGSKALRLDLQYVDNTDTRRNLTAMLEGFDLLAAKARANGFQEVIFTTNSPLLKRFCMKRFGFEEVEGCELRKLL